MPPKLKPTPAYSSNIEIFAGPDSAALTPRTPFSHSARAEEGRQTPRRTAVVDDTIHEHELDEIDLLQTQSHPLLHSSTSQSFPLRSNRTGLKAKDPAWKRFKKGSIWRSIEREATRRRIPIGLVIGCGGAILLLVLLAFSVKKPETLLSYIGVNATAIAYEALDDESKARFNSSIVIDYKAAGYKTFPLTTAEYTHECWNVTNDSRMKFHPGYWKPAPGAELDVLHQKPTKTCSSSITYMLDGSVGLFADLAHLAQTAAFARERNRTLFINDERWNRGRWTDHFLPFSETQPGPQPGCTPPPPEGIVDQWRKYATTHLYDYRACSMSKDSTSLGVQITSARLMFFHMGDPFMDTYEDAYKHTIERKRPIFNRALESFTTAIKPSVDNQLLIKKVRDEITRAAIIGLNMTTPAYIATHIRRGDRKAQAWRYQKMKNEQIPTEEYSRAFWGTYSRLQNLSHPDTTPSIPPLVYLATDSPAAASEFTDLVTSNDTLARKYDNDSVYAFVYELRTSNDFQVQQLASEREYVQAEWNEKRNNKDRIRETRGVIVDWALMTGLWQPTSDEAGNPVQVSDQLRPLATVCAITSNICTLALLGLGWEYGFDWTNGDVGHNPNWVEIDNRGNIAPIWTAFEFL